MNKKVFRSRDVIFQEYKMLLDCETSEKTISNGVFLFQYQFILQQRMPQMIKKHINGMGSVIYLNRFMMISVQEEKLPLPHQIIGEH